MSTPKPTDDEKQQASARKKQRVDFDQFYSETMQRRKNEFQPTQWYSSYQRKRRLESQVHKRVQIELETQLRQCVALPDMGEEARLLKKFRKQSHVLSRGVGQNLQEAFCHDALLLHPDKHPRTCALERNIMEQVLREVIVRYEQSRQDLPSSQTLLKKLSLRPC